MKLLLTSNGLCNDSIRDALRGMLTKPVEESKIVFVPTASNPVRGGKAWLVDDMRRAREMGWKQFEVLDLAVVADWPKELWFSVFEEADVVMFCGGHAHYLSYWLQKSGLMEELPKMLQNKVYIGISAGSIVASKSLATSSTELRRFADEPDDESKELPPGQSGTETMGLTDFLFRPHMSSPAFPFPTKELISKLAAERNERIYMVDDETAIRVIDGNIDVISEGEWHLLTA
jgi:dipeptidase E